MSSPSDVSDRVRQAMRDIHEREISTYVDLKTQNAQRIWMQMNSMIDSLPVHIRRAEETNLGLMDYQFKPKIQNARTKLQSLKAKDDEQTADRKANQDLLDMQAQIN